MIRFAVVAVAALAALQQGPSFAGSQGAPEGKPKEQLKTTLKDAEVRGAWIYDDLDAGFAEAKKSGKPMLVVFR